MDLLIACENIKAEVKKVLEEHDAAIDVIWMNSKLHNNPEQLRLALQNAIDSNIVYENILLAFGNCGNGLVGLMATSANLIIPSVSDCISLLLHENPEVRKQRKHSYFLTKSWIESSQGLYSEYFTNLKKYGDKASRIMKAMFKHYKYLMLVDTGTYDVDEYIEKTGFLAEQLELQSRVVKGDLTMIAKLIERDWDQNFAIVKQCDVVQMSDFDLSY